MKNSYLASAFCTGFQDSVTVLL